MTAKELEHGKAYDCTIDGDRGSERTTIIPLATDSRNSQRFVIVDARGLLKSNPGFLRSLLRMSFREILDEDLDGGPYRQWSSHVWRFTLGEHVSLYYKDFNCYLQDFVPIDLLDTKTLKHNPPR
jgi:hypothetical protein